MKTPLQLCPNCGGPAKLHTRGHKVYFECDGDCWTRTRSYFSLEEAVKEWNQLQSSKYEPEYRDYTCPNCGHKWWADCETTHYPNYCPDCGEPLKNEDGYEL